MKTTNPLFSTSSAYEGQQVNNWTIQSFMVGKREPEVRTMCWAKCSCGKMFKRSTYGILNGKTQRCIECSALHNPIHRRKKSASNAVQLTLPITGNLQITENPLYVPNLTVSNKPTISTPTDSRKETEGWFTCETRPSKSMVVIALVGHRIIPCLYFKDTDCFVISKNRIKPSHWSVDPRFSL